jgi:hypothetical protein
MKNYQKLLYTLNEIHPFSKNLILLRIESTSKHTKMDFGYSALSKYHKGGWIRIAPHTHLHNPESGKKYMLTHVENITIAPEHFHFESTKDWCYFTLYFPPIPQVPCKIDFIEELEPSKDDFNMYDIELDPQYAEILI